MKWNIGINPMIFTEEPDEWVNTDFECPECCGIMQRHNGVELSSYPPMYEYRCKECGAVHYRYQ